MSPVRRSAANPEGQANPSAEEGPPLDGHMRIPIVRDENDFLKLIDGPHQTSAAMAWFSERCAQDLKELSKTRQAKAAYSKEKASALKTQAAAGKSAASSGPVKPTIITPGCTKVINYVAGAPFTAPEHYIKTGVHREYITPRILKDGDSVEYDIMKEDLDFLTAQGFNVHDAQYQNYEENFMRLINVWELATAYGTTPIALEQANTAARSIPSLATCPQNLVNATYYYWLKRRKDLGRPLLRRFWGGASTSHKSPAFTVFQTNLTSRSSVRRPKRTQHEQRMRLYNLREDLVRIQTIIQKVIQRDKYKLLIGELNICIFDQMRQELVDETYVSPYWQHLKKNQFRSLLAPDDGDKATGTAFPRPRSGPSPTMPCKVLVVGADVRPRIPLIRGDYASGHGAKISCQLNPRPGLTVLLYDSEEIKLEDGRRSVTSCRRDAQQLLNIFEYQNDLGNRLKVAVSGSATGPPAATSVTGSKASRRYLDT